MAPFICEQLHCGATPYGPVVRYRTIRTPYLCAPCGFTMVPSFGQCLLCHPASSSSAYSPPPPPPPPAASPPPPALFPPPPALSPYYAIPVGADFDDPRSAYVLLPAYPHLRSLHHCRRRRRRCCRAAASCCGIAFFLSLFASAAAALFILWPSDPDVGVARLRLDRLHVGPPPLAAIDLHLRLDIRVRNPDFFALDYRSVVTSVSYRRRPLGSLAAAGAGGRVRARGVSYLDAELRLDGIEVLDDAVYLIEDLARGSIPFDAVTEVEGTLALFSFQIPVKGRISCSVIVNPHKQEIIRHDCYPE
ncbi:uncharacterized protein LOC109715432 [Ananas comosus]|uniref:Uncharacterized protein LOC109715432 n=1 Tax=Ananas comosus TaxID=4615 RepID=A0A6P5FI51_ANACO|nr:uncharacterized protein LOC109715432 [Ananas comosus]